MSAYLKCPGCGNTIRANERFCGICGMDTLTLIDPPVTVFNPHADPEPTVFERFKSSLGIILGVLILIAAIGGGYLWMRTPAAHTAGQDETAAKPGEPNAVNAAKLTDAAAYLPQTGLNLSLNMCYPGGDAGTMQRITARIVPDVASVTELELMEYKQKQYGYAYHYFPQEDGVYMVYDQSPEYAIPVLKNNLRPGLSWAYKDAESSTVWKVLKTGEKLDLGFVVLENCLVIEEQSDAVKFKKIVYYAPGIGRVMETTADNDECLMIISSLGSMDPVQAAKKVKKWAGNYRVVEP